MFVQGGGGTGKTHLTRVCDAWIRSQQDAITQQQAISLICATTALAAQIFKNATTAHSLFKIPADDVGDEAGEETFVESRLKFFPGARSEEHTSELQSLMRISYAVFCLQKKTTTTEREDT